MMGESIYVELRAVIESGFGEGAYYVQLYSSRFEESLGLKPYPGTLNARVIDGESDLARCISSSKPILIPPPEGRCELKPVIALPAEIIASSSILKVYLVKPLASKHSDDVIELISSVRIRDELRLKDGDLIVVRVYCRG